MRLSFSPGKAFIALLVLLTPIVLWLPVVASRQVYYVSPAGDDHNSGTSQAAPFLQIQRAVDLAQPGDVIVLAAGVYRQDVVSRRSGSPDAPITIRGSTTAVVQGAGSDRVIEINHSYITLEGFTINGLWGVADSASGYR